MMTERRMQFDDGGGRYNKKQSKKDRHSSNNNSSGPLFSPPPKKEKARRHSSLLIPSHSSTSERRSSNSSSTNNNTSNHNNNNKNNAIVQPVVDYGVPIPVQTAGRFPEAGSTLGPYFFLGTLGKGTFSSIHKCINLAYAHTNNANKKQPHHTPQKPCRIAAAKVELSNFVNSGVLLGEALVLHFLDDSLPRGTVPLYMGHYTAHDASVNAAAIVMEYLPGEDMHQLRENRGGPEAKAARRLALEDAVYLTADVMLPLLQRMHNVGIVHRDVKPSNCVRSKQKNFCMVDFGLSKSIVAPSDAPFADQKQAWPASQPWLRSGDATYTSPRGCLRKERPTADFRGTSMYASLRVHQNRDYAPRDDVWSLLYVFCDLVSGGLPWMSYAANRDRDACQRIKEQIHGLAPAAEGGEENKNNTSKAKDDTEQLLMGDEYHVAKFRYDQRLNELKQQGTEDPKPHQLPPKPTPLLMSKDPHKVGLLRQAFRHVASLGFGDEPDYELIQKCLRGFIQKPPQPQQLQQQNQQQDHRQHSQRNDRDFNSRGRGRGGGPHRNNQFHPNNRDRPFHQQQHGGRFHNKGNQQFNKNRHLDYGHPQRQQQQPPSLPSTPPAPSDPSEVAIDWNSTADASSVPPKKRKREDLEKPVLPTWGYAAGSVTGKSGTSSDQDAIDQDVFITTELFEDVPVPSPEAAAVEPTPATAAAPAPAVQGSEKDTSAGLVLVSSEYDVAIMRLPLEMQFRVAQMDYHAQHVSTCPPHIALRDWLAVSVPLVYQEWDAQAYEKGGHRTSTDGYRREFFLDLVERCLRWAAAFDCFRKPIYFSRTLNEQQVEEEEEGEEIDMIDRPRFPKSRSIVSSFSTPRSSAAAGVVGTDLVAVSKVLFALEMAVKCERAKSFAAPPSLSLGLRR